VKKLLLISVVLNLSLSGFGQKWNLNTINEDVIYKYEYWVQFINENDTSSFSEHIKMINTSAKSSLGFTIMNNKNEDLPIVNVVLLSLNKDTIISSTTDFDGRYRSELKEGKYKLYISALGYDNFVVDFILKKNQELYFNIKLGLAEDLTIYQINAKSELNKKTISEIIDCIKVNKNSLNKCSLKKQYLVSMHI